MEGYYTCYSCKGFNKEIILITEEVKRTLASGKYVSCSHCGCKKLKNGITTDDSRKLMNERSYRRHNGAIVQKGGGSM